MTLLMTFEGQSVQIGMKGISDQQKKVMETEALQKQKTPQWEEE